MPVLFHIAWSQQTNPSTPTTMSNAKKQYIGSGKPTEHNGIKVTLRMDEATPHIYTTDKGTFLTFIVSPKQEADKFGKTHTAFMLLREEAPAPAMANEPAGLPEGKLVTENGRKLRKISKKQAAELRAAAQA